MANSVADFLSKRPHDFFMENLADDDPMSLFALRWDLTQFKSFSAFNEFTQKYSCLMQFAGPDYENVDISQYFHEDPSWKLSSDYNYSNHPPKTVDVHKLIKSTFPSIQIPWLEPDQFTKTMFVPADDYADINSMGATGFILVFVADDVDYEYSVGENAG